MELKAQTSVFVTPLGIGWREAARKGASLGFGPGALLWILDFRIELGKRPNRQKVVPKGAEKVWRGPCRKDEGKADKTEGKVRNAVGCNFQMAPHRIAPDGDFP
jgi:hypothetical protein